MKRGERLYYVFCQLKDLRSGTHRYIIYRNKGASSLGGKDLHHIYIEDKASANELRSLFLFFHMSYQNNHIKPSQP